MRNAISSCRFIFRPTCFELHPHIYLAFQLATPLVLSQVTTVSDPEYFGQSKGLADALSEMPVMALPLMRCSPHTKFPLSKPLQLEIPSSFVKCTQVLHLPSRHKNKHVVPPNEPRFCSTLAVVAASKGSPSTVPPSLGPSFSQIKWKKSSSITSQHQHFLGIH